MRRAIYLLQSRQKRVSATRLRRRAWSSSTHLRKATSIFQRATSRAYLLSLSRSRTLKENRCEATFYHSANKRLPSQSKWTYSRATNDSPNASESGTHSSSGRQSSPRSMAASSESSDDSSADSMSTDNSSTAQQSMAEKMTVGLSAAIDRRVYPIALGSLLTGSTIGVIVPMMPQFSADLGMNTLQYGLVISMMGWSRLVFNLPAATCADTYGRRPLLVGGPLLTAAGMFLTGAWVSSMNSLLFCRMLTGAGGCFQMAGAHTYISDISNPLNRARSIAPMQMGFSIGMSLGPLVGGYLATAIGIRATFEVVAVCIGLISLNHFLMCPETLQKKTGTGNGDSSLLMDTKRTVRDYWLPLWRQPSTQSAVLAHTTLWFANAGVIFTLLPLYCSQDLGLDMRTLGGLFAAMSVTSALLSQPMAHLSDRFVGFDRRLWMFSPGIGILAADCWLLPTVTTANEAYAFAVIWALGSASIGSTLTSYLSDIHCDENTRRGHALALMRTGGDCGVMLGSGLLSLVAFEFGTTQACACSSVALLLAAAQLLARARAPTQLLSKEIVDANLRAHTYHTPKTFNRFSKR